MSEEDYSFTTFALLIVLGHGTDKGFEMAGGRVFRVFDFGEVAKLLVTRELAQRTLLQSAQYEYTLTPKGLEFLKSNLDEMMSAIYTKADMKLDLAELFISKCRELITSSK